jgi:hypothetical protein
LGFEVLGFRVACDAFLDPTANFITEEVVTPVYIYSSQPRYPYNRLTRSSGSSRTLYIHIYIGAVLGLRFSVYICIGAIYIGAVLGLRFSVDQKPMQVESGRVRGFIKSPYHS